MIHSFRFRKDKIASKVMLLFVVFLLAISLVIGFSLYWQSRAILAEKSLFDLLGSSEWKPFQNKFGFFPFIMGTLWVTGIAILLAFPLCLLSAIYLSEYAHIRVKKIIVPFVDLLSGIPPIVFGVWGVLFIVPLIEVYIAPHFVAYSTGYSVLAGGIVLAVMIFPLIISVLLEVFNTVPKELRDASLSLGATQWQTIKFVVLKKSLPGIVAAIVLATSRALGETLAVLMVVGNMPLVPQSVFDAGYPLPALLANNYGEMLSLPLYSSALLFSAFILFVIIFLFNTLSRGILQRIEKRQF